MNQTKSTEGDVDRDGSITEKEPLNERLLSVWIRTISILNSDRIASELPLNESIICNILYRQAKAHPDEWLTATDLCAEMKMQKSQMNRTLTNMEKKKLIRRERSKTDRRNIHIIPVMKYNEVYVHQHEKIMMIVDNIIHKMGSEDAEKLTETLHAVCRITEEFTK